MEADELLRGITEDNKSGSTEIAMKVLDFYSLVNPESISMDRVYREISSSHIGMGLVRNLNSLLHATLSNDPLKLGDTVIKLRRDITDQSIESLRNFSGILEDSETVATISNSSAVRETLLKYRDHVSMVYVLEGRPGMEGHALAETLSERGVDAKVVTDSSVQMVSKVCSKAISGSDSILADYTLVHKNGTFPLFLGMKYFGKRNYSLSIDLKFETQFTISNYPVFREHAATEITRLPIAVSNSYYDMTSANLITAYVTNGGVISPGV